MAKSDNRLTLVPVVGTYMFKTDQESLVGKAGIEVSTFEVAPWCPDGHQSYGVWQATSADLKITMSADEYGPRSGEQQDYRLRSAITAKQKVRITSAGLLGAAEGQTIWGTSGGAKAGMCVVWKWALADIDEIVAHRLKKLLVWWDVGVTVRCNNPQAVFEFNGLGSDANNFMTYDPRSKEAKVGGSSVLGFATALSNAVSKHTGRVMSHSDEGSASRERFDNFRFSSTMPS